MVLGSGGVRRAPEGMDQVLPLAGAAAPKGLAGDLLKTAANGVWRGDTGETAVVPSHPPPTERAPARPEIDGGTQLSFDEQE